MGAMSFCFYHIYVSDASQKKLVLKEVLIGKNCMKLFASFPPNAHVKFADLILKLKKNSLMQGIIILTPNMGQQLSILLPDISFHLKTNILPPLQIFPLNSHSIIYNWGSSQTCISILKECFPEALKVFRKPNPRYIYIFIYKKKKSLKSCQFPVANQYLFV